MTSTRRGFLQMLCAAPVALPAVVKAAATKPAPVFGITAPHLDVRNLEAVSANLGDFYVEGAQLYDPRLSALDSAIRDQIHTLTLQVDTNPLKEVQNMSDFSDDVQRLLPSSNDGSFARRLDPDCIARVVPSLQSHRLVYLGSPYSKYPTGLGAAFRDVSAIAADLLRDGVKVYSPICHSHPIAIHGNIDPLNHEIWLPFDQAMMDAADAMCIADMDGWDTSYGVRHEIDVFRKAGKPVYFRSHSGDVSIYSVAGADYNG